MKFSQEQVDDTIIPKIEVGKELVQRIQDLNRNIESIMQTKVTLFGQHFHLSLVSGDKNPTMILSNADETHSQVVPVNMYELKDVADFIYKYLENK